MIYFIFAREIDLIVSGDETAHTTGVNVFKVKMVLIISAVFLSIRVFFLVVQKYNIFSEYKRKYLMFFFLV